LTLRVNSARVSPARVNTDEGVTRTRTDEQTAAIDAFIRREDIVLEAGAGCGKTFTLVEMARAVGRRRGGIYTAFNKKVILDAKPRFGGLRVQTRTTHSLAFATHGRPYAHRLNPDRVPNADDVARMLDVRPIQFDGTPNVAGARFEAHQIVALANRTVRRFTSSADFGLHAGHAPWIPEIRDGRVDEGQYREVVLGVARRIWADLRDVRGSLRFTHDVYRKLWQLDRPQLPGDFIMLDEAQDTPPVVEYVFRDQKHMQRIAVGDSSQAIYGWTGAIDALNTLGGDGAKRLNLTQSFRSGPRIAEEANKWLDLVDAPIRLKGNPAIDSRVEEIADVPDAVINRTNVGAFASALAGLKAGKRVHMVGGGKELKLMASSAEALMDGRRPRHSDLAEFATWDEAVQAAQDEDASGSLRVLVNLVEEHGTRGVIDVLNRLVEAEDAEVVVTTCHKAKGSEWNRVVVGGDFVAPAKGAKLKPEDGRVAYVAVTRAQRVLDRGALAWIDG